MLPKTARLNRAELGAVLKTGTTSHSPNFSLKVLLGKAGAPNKVAVVVSKKVAKTAVLRHRLKRRFYDLFKPLITSSRVSFQAALFIKNNLAGFPKAELTAEIQKLFKQAKLS